MDRVTIKILLKEHFRDASKEGSEGHRRQPDFVEVISFVQGLKPISYDLLRKLFHKRHMLWQSVRWSPLRRALIYWSVWRRSNQKELDHVWCREQEKKLRQQLREVILKKGDLP